MQLKINIYNFEIILNFRYGAFHNLCKAYEIVLSDGSVVWVDETNHEDLFRAVPISYGTLGFLVSVNVAIVPYKPYIKHTYYTANSMEKMIELFEREVKDPSVDTVEGIMFRKEQSVIMSGKFVDATEVRVA